MFTKRVRLFYLEILESKTLHSEIEKEIESFGSSKHISSMILRSISSDPKERPSIQQLIEKSNNLLAQRKDQVVGTFPTKRYGHASALYQDRIFTFGGHVFGETLSKETFRFNISNFEIDLMNDNARAKPFAMCWTTAVTHGQSIFVVGGHTEGKYSNQIYEYFVEKNEWEKVKFQLIHPISRHTMCIYGKYIYIFGGMEKNDRLNVFADLFEFDTENRKIRTIVQEKENDMVPCARYGHAAAIIGDEMFVYGGLDQNDSNIMTNDNFWVFDLIKMQWKKLESKGDVPTLRNGHSLSSWKSTLVLFGGLKYIESGERHIFNSDILYSYSTIDKVWHRVKYGGEFPIKSCGHTAEIYNDTIYIMFGLTWNGHLRNEIYSLDLTTMFFKNLNGTQHILIKEWLMKHSPVCMFCTERSKSTANLTIVRVKERNICLNCFGCICDKCHLTIRSFKAQTKGCVHQFTKILKFIELYDFFQSPRAPVKTGRYEGRSKTLRQTKEPEIKKSDSERKKKELDSEFGGNPFSPMNKSREGDIFQIQMKLMDLEAYVRELEEKLLEKDKIISTLKSQIPNKDSDDNPTLSLLSMDSIE